MMEPWEQDEKKLQEHEGLLLLAQCPEGGTMPIRITRAAQVLSILREQGEIEIHALAEKLGISRASVSSVITKARRLLRGGDVIFTTTCTRDGLNYWCYYSLTPGKGQREMAI